MGIISNMRRPKAMDSRELEKVVRDTFGGGTPAAGIPVSSDTAMRMSTVYSCVNILSRVIGMLPCHVMRKTGKTREIAEDFYLYDLLHDMPNEWMTAPEFFGMIINHVKLRGNFFALKTRGINKLTGPIREIIPLAPGIVQEVKQNSDYSLIYKCRYPDGSYHDVPQSEMMHYRGMVINGFMGVNPIQYIRESISLGLATERFGARHFGSGTHPSMIVSHQGQLDDPKATREALAETYGGLDNCHRIMLLEDGMTATSVSISPEDSQFLETRKYQKSEIVDIFFGMPLTVMSSKDSTPTFASAEQFSIGFIIYALMPDLVGIEKTMKRDLLTYEERKNYYIKIRAEGLQRGSFVEQMTGFQTAINTEIMNPNEARELLDMNPYAGGDKYKTRTSTTKETDQDKDKSKDKKPDPIPEEDEEDET